MVVVVVRAVVVCRDVVGRGLRGLRVVVVKISGDVTISSLLLVSSSFSVDLSISIVILLGTWTSSSS